ncbi:MAG TPA: DUF2225 domain-containing protein [Clostridia bacterium]|nr:DUF2225 domain-containing protein [Clostridia bacterium]
MDINKLMKLGIVEKYSKNEIIIDQFASEEKIAIILSGKAVALSNLSGQGEIVQEIIKPGDFWGGLSGGGKGSEHLNLYALEQTIALILPRNKFEQLIKEEPDLAERIKQREKRGSLVKFSLLPEGHKGYEGQAPLTDEQYLFAKEVICPLCGQNFSTEAVRFSRLKLKQVEPDFRQLFEDFEPIWYGVWVCPHCYYANLNSQFTGLNELEKRKIAGEKLEGKIDFQYSKPRLLEEVFTSYYLALHWQKLIGKDPGLIGNLWLTLAWLYRDVNDMKMYELASGEALEYFEQAYYNSRKNDIKQEQKLAIILGELYFRKNRYEESLKLYQKAIIHRGGNQNYNRQAQDRIQEIREARKNALNEK